MASNAVCLIVSQPGRTIAGRVVRDLSVDVPAPSMGTTLRGVRYAWLRVPSKFRREALHAGAGRQIVRACRMGLRNVLWSALGKEAMLVFVDAVAIPLGGASARLRNDVRMIVRGTLFATLSEDPCRACPETLRMRFRWSQCQPP